MMKKNGFTLVEILIVVSIIVLLTLGIFLIFNPLTQINKSKDTKKVSDLDMLRKVLEDYYNDKNCYPTLAQMCFLGNGNPEDLTDSVSCYICGSEDNSPSLSPYMTTLPCDPDHPKKNYVYYTEGDADCPNSYKIYSDFNLAENPLSEDVGCMTGGCGIPPYYGYDYGVSSDNVSLDTSRYYYCLTTTNTCDNCLSYQNCKNTKTCVKIYGTFETCCESNGGDPTGC